MKSRVFLLISFVIIAGGLWLLVTEYTKPWMLLIYLKPMEHPIVFLGSDEAARRQYEQCMDRGEHDVAVNILMSGGAMDIGNGVEVRLLSEGNKTSWVRVLEGPYSGKKGWVANHVLVSREMVRKLRYQELERRVVDRLQKQLDDLKARDRKSDEPRL